MGSTRFPALHAFLTGAAQVAAPASASAAEDTGGTTLDVGQLEAAMATEADRAAASATTAANTRWNAVLTSDAGKRNPAAAARLLNTTTMNAEGVISTLDDLSPAPAASTAQPDAAAAPLGNAAGTDRGRLQAASTTGSAPASPDTGGGSTAQTESGLNTREHRKRIADERNARTAKAAGGDANVRGGN